MRVRTRVEGLPRRPDRSIDRLRFLSVNASSPRAARRVQLWPATRSHPDLLPKTRFTFIQRNTRFLLSRGPSIEKLCSKNMMRFFSDFGRRRLKIDSPCRNAVLGDLGRSPGESSRNRRSSALEEVDRAGKKVNRGGSWRWRTEVLESGSEALMDYKRPVVFRGEKKENESKPPFYPLSSSPPRPTLVNQLVLASSREPHPPAPPAPRAR